MLCYENFLTPFSLGRIPADYAQYYVSFYWSAFLCPGIRAALVETAPDYF